MPTSQDTVQSLFHAAAATNQNPAYEYDLFDMSVRQKLWSAEYYSKSLLALDISNYIVYPSTSSTSSPNPIGSQYPVPDMSHFCHELNRLLDGFFMNSMSVLDTLAHQIFVLYSFASGRPRKIYIDTARHRLLKDHQNSKLGAFLDGQLRKQWFLEFEQYRHCTTHESLIRFEDIRISYDYITSRYQLFRQVKLPDDPRVRPYTYNRNRIASKYCEAVFERIIRTTDRAYQHILKDIQRKGGQLPIS